MRKTPQQVSTYLRQLGVMPAKVNAAISFIKDGVDAQPRDLPKPELSTMSVKASAGFRFGHRSNAELVGVIPIMIEVAELAIQFTTQDFMIFDGLRTADEQRTLVRKGMSQTMNSMHLQQGDGFSHAFDAVPVVGTIPKWIWDLIYPVACAVDQAATQLGVADKIVWGGAWDRRLSDFGGNERAYRDACAEYSNRHPGKDFIDGPHFEWRG